MIGRPNVAPLATNGLPESSIGWNRSNCFAGRASKNRDPYDWLHWKFLSSHRLRYKRLCAFLLEVLSKMLRAGLVITRCDESSMISWLSSTRKP
jgi:hypothetical protein